MAGYGESSARDLIARFIDSIGIRDEKGIVPFVRAWPDIVGNDLAAHSQVLDIKNGAVLVGLDHPAWLQRMHMDRTRIVRLIQRRFPALDVRYLHMTVVDRLEPARSQRVDTESGNTPNGDDGSAGQDVTDRSEETGPGTRDSRSTDHRSAGGDDDSVPQKADEDPEFLSKLQSLEEAIRRKNGDVD